ncbi:putative reverse transcriptase domain-containing protein [Tanacetum coccineum]
MVTINNPSRGKFRQVDNIGDKREEANGESLRKCTNAIFTTMGSEHQGATILEAPGHFKRDCPKLKNKDGGNRNVQGWVYAVGNAKKRGNATGNPDANVVMGTFLLNNHYASILFDTGADRSFISTAFSSLINITPTPLEIFYDIKLANGKLVRIDTIIRGCTLNFLDYPFNIDLMPVELGSFDVIIAPRIQYLFSKIDMNQDNTSLELLNKTFQRRHSELGMVIFEFQVMPFGLTNAPADEKEYEEHLKEILELLKKEAFLAKYSNVNFGSERFIEGFSEDLLNQQQRNINRKSGSSLTKGEKEENAF